MICLDIIKTIGLKKVYGKGETAVCALQPTDLTILQGEFVAVVGTSGSGKSTLLHMLGGLDRPTHGQVLLEGQDIYTMREEKLAIVRRRKYGFIFQSFNLIPVLSAEENIVLPLLLDDKQIDHSHINGLLDFLGLTKRRKHVPSALSGGQQQRVSIARALANRPSIILADEPTGNLDNRTGKDVLDLLKMSIKKYNQTLLLVTHDTQVAAMADRVLYVEDGIVTDGRARACSDILS